MKIRSVLLLVVLFLVIFALNGCNHDTEKIFNMKQSTDQIVSIEILENKTPDDQKTIPDYSIKAIDSSDIQRFLDEVSNLKYANPLPPPRYYGLYCIRVTYQNGWYEIFGLGKRVYCGPKGQRFYGGPEFADEEQYMAFINKWVDAEEPLTEPT